ncbi:hypothetical protein LWC34_48750 [Kibdelosporangium philippinense]|uniref:Uncharacterized protein n=1 Tax=Kibdelosporangium philippinense TaxID=211113 RepID=A0ABS8ZSE2_9PSEU|nr:hypothetical protein [Kibdelosporangium philippinense]MCE7010643.1 hypothetical protein [Kibdelosporangium philippinense]
MPTYQAADGVSLHYDIVGEVLGNVSADVLGGVPKSVFPHGRPIVTLAGGAARHPSYLGDLAGLTGLVIPHLRGVGKSPGGGKASYWEQPADIEALRGHLDLSVWCSWRTPRAPGWRSHTRSNARSASND